MTYTTSAPTSTSPFNSPAYRKPQKVEAQYSHPYEAMEFQLIRHTIHGIIGRLYSPNRKISTQGSNRNIISNTGKVVLFTSTPEDYMYLAKNCRASNMTANRIRTNLMIQELQGLRPVNLTRPIDPQTIHAVKATVSSEEESPVDTPQTTQPLLLMPAPEMGVPNIPFAIPMGDIQPTPPPEHKEQHLSNVESFDDIEIDLKATLEAMTTTALAKLIKNISVKYKGKYRKAQYIKFLMQHEEETLMLIA